MNFSEFKIIKTERACPLCYSKNTADKIYSFDPFHVLYCDTCNMSYLSPIPGQKEIMAIYSSDTYYSGGDFIGYSDYGLYEKAHSITYRSLLKKIQKMGITGGSLLEVGCGAGFFLKEAIKYFSYRAGLEMGKGSAKIASNWADEISIGPLEHYRGKRKFNLIVALQVIEHIPEPLKFLEMCMALLTKNGKLLISAPDMGSPWRKLLGRKWPSFKIPEHVNFFDRSTLSKALKICGFKYVQHLPFIEAFPLKVLLKTTGVSTRFSKEIDRIPIMIPWTSIAVLAGT